MDNQKVADLAIECLETLASLISELSFWGCKLLKKYGRSVRFKCNVIAENHTQYHVTRKLDSERDAKLFGRPRMLGWSENSREEAENVRGDVLELW
jgi:hypothetical protein